VRRHWHIDLAVLTATVLGLLIGGALWSIGSRGAADWAWTAASAPAAILSAWRMLVALWRRETGLDLLALLAIAGALALHQGLTAAVIALMLATGNLLESFAERRAGRAMAALVARVPRTVQVYRDDTLAQLPVDAVQPGDRVLVRHGGVLAVDGTLAADRAVLDEAALTGESVPNTYRRGALLRSGAVNAGDAFDLLATASAAASTYAGVVRLVEAAQRAKAPAMRLADRYAAWFVPLALGLAGIGWVVSGDAMRALAVIVVATPCPLLLAVPVAVMSGLSRCAARGVLVKGGGVLEALAAARMLFFDKTGTLTGGSARLVSIEPTAVLDANAVLAIAASLEQASHHVTAAAVVAAAQARGLALSVPAEVVEVPGAGVRGSVDGRRVAVGSRAYVEAIAAVPEALGRRLDEAARDGMSAVLVAADEALAGVLLLADQLRPEAPRALRLLRRAGIRRVVMLTGDRQEIAEAIAAGLGIDDVIAGQGPADKLVAVGSAAGAGTTIMVGDGINDAPALAAADVGVAMGVRGATAAAEAAGIVLLVDRLDRLAEALHIARRTRAITLQSVLAGMGLSITAMLLALWGWLPPLHGAVLQEAIDVAVILNALRVLRVGTPRVSRHGLRPEELERLSAQHARLAAVLDRLTAVADRLPTLDGVGARQALQALDAALRDELLPHERDDDREVYPALAPLLGGDDPLAALSRTHREIFHLHRRFSGALEQLDPGHPDADALRSVQRTLYALDAILRLHFAQEEEIYQGLAAD
jgi:heavy metal translocating P-type ATPase